MRRRSQAAADPMGDLQTEGAGPSTPLLGSESKVSTQSINSSLVHPINDAGHS